MSFAIQSNSAVISGTGLWIPEHSISNEELVDAYNRFAEQFNADNANAIATGEIKEKPLSSTDFIAKASGILSRYVLCKDGILDINRMRPKFAHRAIDELSQQAEMATNAAKAAMLDAKKSAMDIDAVIVSCANTQRPYPAIAIEVQNELGIQGFGFDMLVACSAGTFALQRAYEMVIAQTAKCILVINPELASPQINYKDRDSHFIFGDVATATIVETVENAISEHQYAILGTKAFTQFSNNIRSDSSFVARATDIDIFAEEHLFRQQGHKVFKEICPLAAEHITQHLTELGIENSQIKRWWLHQANINMNQLITKKLLGRKSSLEEAPIVLERFANTGSAGSIVAFNLHNKDLKSGDLGLICSFGAGYSIGSLALKKR